MFKAELIERAATFRSAMEDPTRRLESCPSLVLNADYTPLSYYPLSLWPWQTAIKAVFLERVDIVASYDRCVHSVSLDMQIPSVIALRQYVQPERVSRLHPLQPVPARPLLLPVLRQRAAPDLRPRRARAGWAGKTTWENILTACAPCNMKKGGRTPKQAHMHPLVEPIRPTHWQLQQHGKRFPPDYLHETWRDWLYWDIELEA